MSGRELTRQDVLDELIAFSGDSASEHTKYGSWVNEDLRFINSKFGIKLIAKQVFGKKIGAVADTIMEKLSEPH